MGTGRDEAGTDVRLVDRCILFTDIEGSTARWEREPEIMRRLLKDHDDLIVEHVEAEQGQLLKTMGDGAIASFADAALAVNCAIQIQHGLAACAAPHDPLKVRMGLHSGAVEVRDGDLFGPPMNRAARIMGAAHGEQIAVSEIVAQATDLVGVEYEPLGVHRLKGLSTPETVLQVVAPGLRTEFPPLNSLNADLGNLPQAPEALFGRRDELQMIAAALRQYSLVSLLGPGGVGKTQLALHAAAASEPLFSDGVWFIDLAEIAEDGRVAIEIASVLGVRSQPDVPLAELLSEFAARRNLLLVLDNCEHVQEEVASFVESLSTTRTTSKILATSQLDLDISFGHQIHIQPLPIHDPGSDVAIEDDPAVQLFVARARRADPEFELTADDLPVIRTICRELDGLPLALELAAARCRSLGPEGIASRLDDRLSLLQQRRGKDRHRTLRNAIAWSFELLDDEQQEFLCNLSQFQGTFDLESAASVAGIDEFLALDLVDELLRRSLLHSGDPGFRLLDSVRQFGDSVLNESGRVEAAQQRHTAWVQTLASEPIDSPDVDYVVARLTLLERHSNDCRVALRDLLESDPAAAADLALRLIDFWIGRDRHDEALEWMMLCSEAVTDPAVRIELLGWVSGLTWTKGMVVESEMWARAAITEAEEAGLLFPAYAGTRLGLHLLFDGRAEEANEMATRALETLAIDPAYSPRLYGVLGLILDGCGDRERGLEVCEEAVRLGREAGAIQLVTALVNQMIMTAGSGDTAELVSESMDLMQRLGRRSGYGHLFVTMSRHLQSEGRVEESLENIVEGLELLLAEHQVAAVLPALDLAASLLGQNDPSNAALVASAIESQYAQIGEQGYDLLVRRRSDMQESVRVKLGDEEYDKACARGARLTLEETVDHLRWVVDQHAAVVS